MNNNTNKNALLPFPLLALTPIALATLATGSGNWVSLNLHLFDSPIRRQSRLVQFSRLYRDAKRTVLRLFRRLLTFTLEDIAMFALTDSDLPRQLLTGSSLAIGC